MCKLGVIPCESFNYIGSEMVYPVLIDGRMTGYVLDSDVENFVNSMRILKVRGEVIPKET